MLTCICVWKSPASIDFYKLMVTLQERIFQTSSKGMESLSVAGDEGRKSNTSIRTIRFRSSEWLFQIWHALGEAVKDRQMQE
jgi:hypothetical protein